MLPLSGKTTVLRDGSPVVFKNSSLPPTDVYHRLDREGHAGLDDRPLHVPFNLADHVRDRRVLMEDFPGAVPGELFDYREAVLLSMRLNNRI